MKTSHNSLFKFATAVIVGCAAIALAEKTSHGAPISVTLQGSQSMASSSVSASPAPPANLFLVSGGAMLNLPAPQPDDWDRVLNYQIGDPPSLQLLIREEDAAGLGLDWDAFENSLNGSGKSVVLRFRGTVGNLSASDSTRAAINRSGQHSGFEATGLIGFEMEEVRVNVGYYFWHPILTGLRAAQISFEIDGSGTVVPEPSSLTLALIVAFAFVWRRRLCYFTPASISATGGRAYRLIR